MKHHMHQVGKKHIKSAFTLVEVLVTVAILSIVAALAITGIDHAILLAKKTKEVNAARESVIAFLAYAQDNNGELMPGHEHGASVQLPDGGVAAGPEATRYPWRLAPYLNWRVEKYYMINDAAEQITGLDKNSSGYRYAVSLGPALGINAYCVGGYYSVSGRLCPHDAVTRSHQLDRNLVLFASARMKQAGEETAGYWFIQPPRLGPLQWKAGDYDPSQDSRHYGHIDYRYNNQAVVGMTDGSVKMKSLDDMRDSRLWSRFADNPKYEIKIK